MIKTGAIESAEMFDSFERFILETGRDMEEEVRIVARNLAVSFAYATVPIGFGGAARAEGRAAIARDIAKLFTSPSGFYGQIEEKHPDIAREFWKAWKSGDYAGMEAAIRKTARHADIANSVSRERHRNARNRRGRVTGSHTKTIVLRPGAIQDYTRHIQSRSGSAKAGWAAAAADTGGQGGIPAWASLSQHPDASGGAVETRADGVFIVTITNDVPWIRDLLSPQLEERATDLARRNMETRFQKIIDARSSDPF